ncbi:DEAD/DEAH box helicase [Methanobrevibacter olleyae]|uniref:Hef nuclease n=1 Tax=Methanobrevibacter olleyae TaxID=294671 RepID=A0A126R233_METOL|nr:DEAD/DEAH box helicase [Methanobrevibacter olleyae]AMK16341.1 Hef nuclease [Methanobrevibacter olleyae]
MVTYIEHPLIRPNSAEARIYQQVLAADVLKNGNTMIVAPTALGKTIIAMLVAADRLQKFNRSKILVLAPSKPLTIQHEENFKDFLNVHCTSITGAVKTSEREKRWNESQVICATPQTVESDLLNERYSLDDVSLVVFDECHHAVGSYSYVYLASRYIKECQNHLILGLTASPGHDKNKIKEVCENLFIQDITIKTEEDPDVKPYFNPINIDWVKVEMGPQLEKIRDLANKALKVRLKGLKTLGVINTVAVNKRDILKARSKVQRRIGQSVNPPKECFQAMSILSAVINLQHALNLLETQGVAPFNDYVARLRKKTTRAAKNILADPNFSKAVYYAKEAEEYGLEHPKMKKLIELLKLELGLDGQTRLKSLRDEGKNKDSPKIIVFTQFRDTLDMIHERCEKEGIKSVRFYGQGTSDGKKGLTQKEQKNIIKSFKTGNYDVLISTSVAEEGIDIPAVDLVILYEPVPSEIRMIQRRGRTGRKSSGRMKVLITKNTIDEGYYWTSVRRESRMKTQLATQEAIEELKLNAVEKIEAERSVRVLGKKEKSIVEEPVNSDIEEELDEETKDEDLEEIDLENENEERLAEFKEKKGKEEQALEDKEEQALEDAIYEELAKNPQNQELVVYVDSREGNSKVIRALDTIGVKVKINTMSVADYQVSEEVAIERKTAKDFVDSIVDKRLFKQARMMMEEFKKPIIILEGDDFYSGFINPNAIRGAMTSIVLDYGISIIPTRTAEDTAAMIKRIAVREQKGEKRSIQIRTEKKPQNLWEQQLFIIESLPNIGPVNAKNLLEHFGSVKAVLEADEKQLQEVNGIGKKTAKNIREVIEGKYLYFKKDKNQKKLK